MDFLNSNLHGQISRYLQLENLEIEIRFGTFRIPSAPGSAPRFLFLTRGNFYQLMSTLNSQGIPFSKILSTATIHADFRKENAQIVRKQTLFKFDNQEYGFRFAVSQETPIRDIKLGSVDLIREKTRYRYDMDNGYLLDLTRVEERKTDNFSVKYEVELEVPRNFKVKELNQYIQVVLQLLYGSQELLTIRDKIDVFTDLNKHFGGNFVGSLDSRTLTQLRNLKAKDLLSGGMIEQEGSVSIKIDGLRRFLWISEKNAYLVMAQDFLNKLSLTDEIPRRFQGSLFEGEFLDNVFYLYDTLIYQGQDVRNKSHRDRLDYAVYVTKFDQIDIRIELKKFYPFHNSYTFFDMCDYVLSQTYSYPTDGIVITPNSPGKQTLKWKPIENLTIDFLYRNERLYMGGKDDQEAFPHQPPFSTFEGVPDNVIVEVRFVSSDDGKERKPEFVRMREDKPYPNSKEVALSVWEDIEKPISEGMIRGKEFGLIFRYHNRVKDSIHSEIAGNPNVKKSLMTIGAGAGGDLYKYQKYGFVNPVLIEPDLQNRTKMEKRLSELNMPATVLPYKGQDVNEIMQSVGEKRFDALTYMLSLSFFFDTQESTYSIIRLAKAALVRGGYFAALSIDGNKVRAMMQMEAYYTGPMLNLKQIQMQVSGDVVDINIPNSIVREQREYLTNLQYLADLFRANGFAVISLRDVDPEPGLNGEEMVYNSLFSILIVQKL